MIDARIISIENPTPYPINVCPQDFRHSKWVVRRKYVEATLLPQIRRMPFSSADTLRAVVETDIEVLYRTPGEPNHFVWMEHDIDIMAGNTPCLLSNFILWKQCVETGHTILSLEDDAKLLPQNEQAVYEAIKEFDEGSYTNDILYLQLACPFLPDSLKSFHSSQCKQLSPRLTRLNYTSDLAGTVAYAVKPASAQTLMDLVLQHGTNSTDNLLHSALKNKNLGVLIMTEYQKGFLLDNHFAEWNHIHNPNQV